MKNNTQNKLIPKDIVKLYLLVFFLILGMGCSNEVKEWETATDQLSVTDYVYSEPEKFSEFGEILQLTGIENLLRVRGPFTLVLPTNDAMQEYYARNNASTYSDISIDELSKMVYTHIFPGEISTGSIGLGTLPYKNALGDFVASDFDDTDIVLNKSAYIIKRDIIVANGYVHHIDYTLDPIEKSVYDVLKDQPAYSIFVEGLERTNLKDTLDKISFPYGNDTARTRYTLLAVPDTLYQREGINNIDDLIATYSSGDDLTDPNNEFYRYMVFHCLSGSYYFSDFPTSGIYYILSQENYLSITVDDEFRINKTDSGYTGFYYAQSNFPAKNGVIHTINTQLPYIESDPTEIIFQTTDYFDFQQGDYYQNYYKRFYDGENTFQFIKWEAEFMLYYFKSGQQLMDDDGLNLKGHFWIEITTPVIRKGKYEIGLKMFGGDAVLAVYVDDEYLAQYDIINSDWNDTEAVMFSTVNFTETKTHKLKLKTVVPGDIWWDHVKLTPIDY